MNDTNNLRNNFSPSDLPWMKFYKNSILNKDIEEIVRKSQVCWRIKSSNLNQEYYCYPELIEGKYWWPILKGSGYKAFIQHHQEGFPVDCFQDLLHKTGWDVDMEEYNFYMDKEREKSRHGKN